MTTKPTIRCAVYTRKSSDDGLDQDFNSLDAQYEACTAYVASQRHEGWKLSTSRYDDGGISGGTLERPALQRLMSDIDAGRIDIIVVYKIDRLTRSLADFAKLVDRLDAASASFVSVTQAFNTATSMGRLTLNVLLSFAQFEREVTAERIRDKIAASKKKGLWMGGVVPLGYDPHPDPLRRELVVNAREAETVAMLFRLYDDLGGLGDVVTEATRLGLRSKLHRFSTGRDRGGKIFSRGQLHHLLTNPIYRGLIRHKDQLWPGQHPTIVPQDLWDRVQSKLAAKSARKRGQVRTDGEAVALLSGKFRDETGDRLTPTHSQKRGRRHRYYVSNRLISGGTDVTGWRLPAAELDVLVAEAVAAHLKRHATQHSLLDAPDAVEAADVASRMSYLAADLRTSPHQHLARLITEGRIARDTLNVNLDRVELGHAVHVSPSALSSEVLTIDVPMRIRRRGVETKLISGAMKPVPDRTLIRTLSDAHRWVALHRGGASFAEIGRREGKDESFIRARAQLAFLAPNIQVRILDGTLAPDMTLHRLLHTKLPLEWTLQTQRLGL